MKTPFLLGGRYLTSTPRPSGKGGWAGTYLGQDSQLFQDRFVHPKALLPGGEGPAFDILDVLGERFFYRLGQSGILFRVLRHKIGEQPKHVVEYLDLSVALNSSPDADGRHSQLS